MKLLLHRSHRLGMLGGHVIYSLDARAYLTEEELANVATFGLAGTRLYHRLEVAERGRGILGIAFHVMFQASNLTVDVKDLIRGKRVECSDFLEMLSLEDQLKDAARQLRQVLAAAAHFDGDEVVDL